MNFSLLYLKMSVSISPNVAINLSVDKVQQEIDTSVRTSDLARQSKIFLVHAMKVLWGREDVAPLIYTQSLAGDERSPSRLGRLPVAIEPQRLSGRFGEEKNLWEFTAYFLTYSLHGAESSFIG
jgi:hypothetical protein